MKGDATGRRDPGEQVPAQHGRRASMKGDAAGRHDEVALTGVTNGQNVPQ
jgi:hypothetical protein